MNVLRNGLGLLALEDKRSPEAVALIKPPQTASTSASVPAAQRAPLEIAVSTSEAPGGPPVLECVKSPQPLQNRDPIASWLSSFRANDLNWTRQHSEFADQNHSPQKEAYKSEYKSFFLAPIRFNLTDHIFEGH